MRKLLSVMVAVFAVIMCTGCAITANQTTNMNVVETSVVLQDANFHVVRHVSTEISQSYVFGIGGISKRALRDTAIAELTKEANLQGSQALINVAVKTSSENYLIYNRVTFIATGTVIEFEK